KLWSIVEPGGGSGIEDAGKIGQKNGLIRKKTNFDCLIITSPQMNIRKVSMLFTGASCMAGLLACQSPEKSSEATIAGQQEIKVDQFADLEILRYHVPGWEALSLQQKELAYYL